MHTIRRIIYFHKLPTVPGKKECLVNLQNLGTFAMVQFSKSNNNLYKYSILQIPEFTHLKNSS